MGRSVLCFFILLLTLAQAACAPDGRTRLPLPERDRAEAGGGSAWNQSITTETQRAEKQAAARTLPAGEPASEGEGGLETEDALSITASLALSALAQRLADTAGILYVYRDGGHAANWFSQRARLWEGVTGNAWAMRENWSEGAYSGRSCIRCRVINTASSQGGWQFLNGYLPQGKGGPLVNDKTCAGAQVNLSGARELRFFARGEAGGEQVEFFTAGFGREESTGRFTAEHPDSAPRQSLGLVTLKDYWTEYVIDLTGADLTAVACGFGFLARGKGETAFYLDEIRFVGPMTALSETPRLLPRAGDVQSAALTEENALAAMAFLSAGQPALAKPILLALMEAVNGSPLGRIQNAYAPGVFGAYPGWESGPRPGLKYNEDEGEYLPSQAYDGSSTQTVATAALALMQYNRVTGDGDALKAAGRAMDWVLSSCQDGEAGFTDGVEGSPENQPREALWPKQKSLSANLCAYVALLRLSQLTGEERYGDGAQSALIFIDSMYDSQTARFHTGFPQGALPEGETAALCQILPCLGLGDLSASYEPALLALTEGLSSLCARETEGTDVPSAGPGTGELAGEASGQSRFSFDPALSQGQASDTQTYEKSTLVLCQGALGLYLFGEQSRCRLLLNAASQGRLPSGLFGASASSPEFRNARGGGTEALWHGEESIAATAWFLLAQGGYNPYGF